MEKSEEQQQVNESSTSVQENSKQQRQQQEANKSLISQLPSPILVNILSRLPFKTIHICKCVCKSWLNFSSDPYFADTHFVYSATCILAHPPVTNDLGSNRKNPFVVDWRVPFVLGHDVIVKFDPDAIPFSKKCRMVNSCDGLVCLMCPLLGGSFCVCNPISGEFVMIPSKKWNSFSFSVSSFGLSRESNKYKIVDFSDRFGIQGLQKWNVYVFTIGMDKSWRKIGPPVSLGGDPTCNSLNGRNHWLVTDLNDSEFIRCFDFDCETLQSVFPPKEFEASNKTIRKWLSLGVMDDCLCLYDHSRLSYQFDIWVMKEYGVQESWTKMFVISSPLTRTEGLPTNLLNDGEFLIFFDHKRLVSFDVFEIVARTDGAIAYKPSFIMLKEIARRQNWELVDIQRHMW